jgi:hypothetical protein
MMIDDETLKQLLQINDELLQLCKWLNEKRDMETSSRLIPLVDDLTHILDRSGQEQITLMQPRKGYFTIWESWSASGAGDQWTVSEMWLSAGVGCRFRKTPYSPICLAPFDLSSLNDVYRRRKRVDAPG